MQRNGLTNLLALLAVGGGGLAVARYTNSLAGQVAVVFIGLGLLVAIVSWFQMRLEDNERLERLELDELARSRADTALFQARSAEGLPAQRSREQFERYFVPIFTALLCLAQGAGAFLLWRWLRQSAVVVEVRQPTVALAIFALFALVLFLLGKFSSTIARLGQHRLLRPGAGYLLLSAYLCFLVSAGVGAVLAHPFRNADRCDFYVARGLCVLLALVALETLLNLVLEIYRPRVKGKVQRPLYESRLVGLLGQPEGLITTAAQALDYQFGFKVSETWFYRFFEQALGWLLLLQLAVLLLSTCFVVIEAGEAGLLERCGRPVPGRTLLPAGLHVKWPWPIDQVYRFRTDQIQRFSIGFTPQDKDEKESIVLWTLAHTKEENFLVANRGSLETTNQATGKRTPPVSLVTVSIPVQFQIHDLLKWEYRNEDAAGLLQDLGDREVVRYLAGADLNELMSTRRGEASEELVRRIQRAADERNLGVRIISVGLEDLHPPVKVAPEYEKVIAAIQTKEAKILAAQADDIRTNALAEAQATSITNQASAEALGREVRALAQAALFTNQIPAFQAAPSVYAMRSYLQTFVRATTGARKYVLLTTNTHDVITLDLQDKIRGEMYNELNVPPQKTK
jgi:modulator of FtsH protease HflK